MARYAPDPAQRVTVFLGEAGCGKSELAVQWALTAAERRRDVHFFDLDQTKPLLRSRDAAALLEGAGVTVHFEQQCADAPTQVGGLVPLLLDKSKSVEQGLRLLTPYVKVEAAAVSETLLPEVEGRTELPLLPLTPRMTVPETGLDEG